MADIKYMDAKEFKELGYLQECNRQFFHPHGLALELTSVDEGGDTPLRKRIYAALAKAGAAGIGADADAVFTILAEAVTNELAPPGSVRFSGCWDYRHDPEAIYFGDWQADAVAKVEAVQAERRRHYLARARMFGTVQPNGLEMEAENVGADAVLASDLKLGLDIEPTTFVKPPGPAPAES